MVCVPPPKEKVGGRSQGDCDTLLATIAAIAPAAPAFATFILTAQTPRSISRICPRNGVPVHELAGDEGGGCRPGLPDRSDWSECGGLDEVHFCCGMKSGCHADDFWCC